jgi:hypothetical protein
MSSVEIQTWLKNITNDSQFTDNQRTAAGVLLKIVLKDNMTKVNKQTTTISLTSTNTPPFDPPYRDSSGKLIVKE